MTNANHEYLSDFQICHLHSLLTRELGCGSFETDTHIAWFAKNWRYLPPQRTQANFNAVAREEIIQHVGKPIVKKVEPLKIETWTPCRNETGLCEDCRNRGRGFSGSMVLADALWRENHKFVAWYVGVVLSRRNQQAPPQVREDIASMTWHRVAQTIHLYRDPGNGTQRRAWLKKVADWVVQDYFRDSWRLKRDSRKDVSFEALEAS